MQNEPIVVERIYHAPIARVWTALTDPDEMKKWYFDVHAFRPEKGCEFSFYAGEEGKKYTHLCRVTEVIPERKIAYTWRYEGWEGDSEVSFELFPEGDDKTRVVLTHTGLDTFPADKNPDLKKSNFAMGWDHIIGISLRDFVEKA